MCCDHIHIYIYLIEWAFIYTHTQTSNYDCRINPRTRNKRYLNYFYTKRRLQFSFLQFPMIFLFLTFVASLRRILSLFILLAEEFNGISQGSFSIWRIFFLLLSFNLICFERIVNKLKMLRRKIRMLIFDTWSIEWQVSTCECVLKNRFSGRQRKTCLSQSSIADALEISLSGNACKRFYKVCLYFNSLTKFSRRFWFDSRFNLKWRQVQCRNSSCCMQSISSIKTSRKFTLFSKNAY